MDFYLRVYHRTAAAADHAGRLVADMDGLGESGRELRGPPVGVARSDSVGEAIHRAVEELVSLPDDLLVVIPGTTALSRVSGGASSSHGKRGSSGAGRGGGDVRRSSSDICGRSGGSSDSRGVVVGANAVGNHVDGHEALIASEVETSDRGLDALEQLAAILRLLLIVRAGEVELVAANVVVPHGRTSWGDAGGRVAHAVLVATLLVADLLVSEVDAEYVVEDGTAVGPGGLRVVSRHDVENVTLGESPLVRHVG